MTIPAPPLALATKYCILVSPVSLGKAPVSIILLGKVTLPTWIGENRFLNSCSNILASHYISIGTGCFSWKVS